MRYLPLIAVVLLAVTACSSQSSNGSGQSSSDQSNAAAGSTRDAASTKDASAGEIPDYPGAATEAASTGSNMGESASGKVMTTGDSFDKVYSWYQKNMPAGSEKSHTESPIEAAVFMIGDLSSGQKSVTITTQGGKTMITIASVKS
jgi:hypothetical protein